RVVFDRRLRVPPTARLFSTLDAGPVIIITTPDTLAGAGSRAAALERAGGHVEAVTDGDLPAALQRLGERQVVSLLLEGGPTLQRSAVSAGVVDAVHLYVSRVVFGSNGVPWLSSEEIRVASLVDREVLTCGPDVLIEGYVHRPD